MEAPPFSVQRHSPSFSLKALEQLIASRVLRAGLSQRNIVVKP